MGGPGSNFFQCGMFTDRMSVSYAEAGLAGRVKRPVGVLQNKLSPIKRSMGPTLNLEIRGHPTLLRRGVRVNESLESPR